MKITMTVQQIVPYAKYVTNGADSVYTVNFFIEDKENLFIKLNDVVVSMNDYNYLKDVNGIEFHTPLLANQKLEIFRKTKLERTTNFESFNNTFRPEVLNKDLDKIWLTLQEQSSKVDQYDLDYEYVVRTSSQALTEVKDAQARADDAYELADLTNTEIRPIPRGGTGANNASDARNNLDVHSKAEVLALVQTGGAGEVLSIESGGTGGMTVEAARTNLDVYSKDEVNTAITTSVPKVADATTIDKGIVRLATESDITNSSETAVVTPKHVADMLVGIGSLAKGFRALFSARLTQMTGTSSSNNRIITCTITAHGLSVGDVISINYTYYAGAFAGSKRVTDTVAVTSVANANTFTFTTPQSSNGSSSASNACTLYYVIKVNYNINSLVINSEGRYTISINTASGIIDTSFIPFIQATTTDNSLVIVQPEAITSATSLTVRTFNAVGTAITPQWLHIGVTQ